MRARARAQVDRLADVQRAPVGVAEDVHARLVREPREVGPLAARAPRRGRPRAARAPRGEQRDRLAHGAGVRAQPPEQRAEHARAGLARPAARGAPRRRRRPARRPARPGRAGAAAARSGAPRRPCRAPAGPATPAPRARTPGAARARRTRRCAPPARGPRSCAASRGSTSSRRRRGVDHRLRDPGEALDPAPERVATPTSELHSSCSSPPPTSTAPTSVSSQRSPARPLVSVSRATNSADARGCSGMDRTASARVRTVQRRLHDAPPIAFGECADRSPRWPSPRHPGSPAAAAPSRARTATAPPPPVTMTAAVHDDAVEVSPASSAPA